MNESLRNLPLKKLKEKAVNLGIRGTTSRTKYTKNNRGKLIDDITAREVLQGVKSSENLDKNQENSENLGKNQENSENSHKNQENSENSHKNHENSQENQKNNPSEELCNPTSFKSIKDTKVEKSKNLSTKNEDLSTKSENSVQNDDEISISWIIGGVLAVMGAAISIISVKLLNSKDESKVKQNIINNI